MSALPSKTREPIKAITWDFWGTLYFEGANRSQRQQLRQEYTHEYMLSIGRPASPAQIEVAFQLLWHDLEHLRMVNHSGLSAEEIGRRLARTMNIELDQQQAVGLGERVSSAGRAVPPTPAQDAKAVLSALRGRVKMAVISDTGMTLGHDLYAVMEADGLAQLMDHFTFSDQTGTCKPELRQFSHTLHRLGCRPEQAVHVGDMEHSDIAGAKAAGMRAIRILHDGQDPTTQADALARNLTEAAAVLRQWGVSS